MSRIDEALKQAGYGRSMNQAFHLRETIGLDHFPGGVDLSLLADKEAENPPMPIQREEPQLGLCRGTDSRYTEKLVAHEDSKPLVAEQYRRLAAVLHQSNAGQGIKVVMITSAQTGDGKTLTAANVALTLSESYRRRVLLVDADLRRPTLHTLFHAPNSTGLSDLLKAPEHRRPPLIELTAYLTLLPGGEPDPDPMASLTSGRLQEIIEDATSKFDWIILDTPPVALLPDASLLCTMVDAAVLVIDAGRTPCGMAQKAVETIGREKTIGVILNRVEEHSLGGYYRYDTDAALPASR